MSRRDVICWTFNLKHPPLWNLVSNKHVKDNVSVGKELTVIFARLASTPSQYLSLISVNVWRLHYQLHKLHAHPNHLVTRHNSTGAGGEGGCMRLQPIGERLLFN